MSNYNNKSIQQAYNTATQAVTATATPILLLGTQTINSGCSIGTVANGFIFRKSGKYLVDFDVTFTPSAAGIEVMQLYLNGLALPYAVASDTTVADATYTRHITAVIPAAACCALQPALTLVLSGVAGSVTYVKGYAVKEC